MRYFVKLAAFAALSLIASLAMSSQASAGYTLEIWASADGGAYTLEGSVTGAGTATVAGTTLSTAATNFNVTSTGGASYSVSVLAASLLDGAGKSDSTSGSFNIADNANDTNNHSLSIMVTASGFNLPTVPRYLFAQQDGLAGAGFVSGTVQAFANNSNTLGDSSGAPAGSTSSFVLPVALAGSGMTTPVTFGPGSTQYSLTAVATLTTNNGASITNFGFEGDVVAPEPTSLAIFACGLPLLGFFGARRRRKTTIAA